MISKLTIKCCCFIAAAFLFLHHVSAQETTDSIVPLKDISDVFSKNKPKNPHPKADSLEQKKIYFALLPIVGYGPANGFVIGAGTSISSLLGNPATTHISTALLNLTVTTKEQTNLNIRTNIFTKDDGWILQGDWRALIFTQPTYGLGIYNDSLRKFELSGNNISMTETDQQQPMSFNYIRFYENVYKRIKQSSFYVGIGVNIDYHFRIIDERLSLTPPTVFLTSHYKYSIANGFDPTSYSANGLSLNFIYDARDNSINPYKGQFAQLSFRANTTLIGSSANSSTLFYDYRNYFTFNKAKPNNIFAVWTFGQFLTGGKLPYLALPSITWDMYNRSGRGYVQGRFRGENMVYAETEYRFPLTPSGLWGMVAFLNMTTADNQYTGQSLFNSVAPGYGVGFRLKVNKKTRTNVGVDFGFGSFHSSGIYFNLNEAF